MRHLVNRRDLKLPIYEPHSRDGLSGFETVGDFRASEIGLA